MGPEEAGIAEIPPVEVGFSTTKRSSARSDIRGMTDDLAKQPVSEPTLSPHFNDDMSYEKRAP